MKWMPNYLAYDAGWLLKVNEKGIKLKEYNERKEIAWNIEMCTVMCLTQMILLHHLHIAF